MASSRKSSSAEARKDYPATDRSTIAAMSSFCTSTADGQDPGILRMKAAQNSGMTLLLVLLF
jgi:hypothetical protein